MFEANAFPGASRSPTARAALGFVVALAVAGCDGRKAIAPCAGGAACSGTGGASGGRAGSAGVGGRVVTGSGGTGGARRPTMRQPTRDVDILFMIGNSSGMDPLQQVMLSGYIPAFIERLRALPGGLPNLRLAVVSSSMGAGRWADVPGCEPQPLRNDDGVFHHTGVNPPGCVEPRGSYIVADAAGNNNFTGDLAAVLGCIGLLGGSGCGFNHPMRSVQAALERTFDTSDPENGGFLRDNAALVIVMLTEEDDCSVPPDSDLLDPRQSHVSDPFGGLQTGYRCNEFGHLCNGRPPPHTVTGDTPLAGCTSAEDRGRLVLVQDLVTFLRALKADPDNQIFVAVLAGAVEPYVVELRANIQTADGSRESQPAIKYSCSSGPIAGAPSVRLKLLTDTFGVNGTFASVCDDDWTPPFTRVADWIGRYVQP